MMSDGFHPPRSKTIQSKISTNITEPPTFTNGSLAENYNPSILRREKKKDVAVEDNDLRIKQRCGVPPHVILRLRQKVCQRVY